jgi:DNA polymerase III delta prime subunit
LNKILIIFLGPQGSGKTTQAILLKRKLEGEGYKVAITEGIYYTLFLWVWHKIVMILTGRKIRYKFRDNAMVEEFVEPLLLIHISKIDFIINLFSAIFSFLKISLLLLFYPIVIEHEGYIYNHLTYLIFIYRKLFTIKFVLKMYKILLRLMPRKRLVILLDISSLKFSDLYIRYKERGSLSEPWYYIRYQAAIYKAFASVEPLKIVLDAGMDKDILANIAYKLVLQIYKSLSANSRT